MKTKGLALAAAIGILGAAPVHAAPRCTIPQPDYPAVAKREWQQGIALVDLKVSADGRVEQASLAKSTGSELLDTSAVVAARQAKCAAGQAETLSQPISFEMNRSYYR